MKPNPCRCEAYKFPHKRGRKCHDEKQPDGYEDTSDWPDDKKLDDNRRGQAKWINR